MRLQLNRLSPWGGEPPTLIIHSHLAMPLFFKEKATGQLEGFQGWDLAYWLAMGHTRVGYILDGGILQPSHWNSDTLTYSRFVGAKSRSMALCTLAIEPSTGRAKSRVLVSEPSLILCFTLNCHWVLLFWKITLKVIFKCLHGLYICCKSLLNGRAHGYGCISVFKWWHLQKLINNHKRHLLPISVFPVGNNSAVSLNSLFFFLF